MLGFLSQIRTADKALLLRSCWRSARPRRGRSPSLRESLEAAYRWICVAQDATRDGGVAAWFDLIRGWSASYPETTGYIIPTLLTYASVLSDPDARNRAIRMADWEVEVQLPTGAVRSGTLAAKVCPAVFNTGQALFGWVAAYRTAEEKRYAEAAQRAAHWLLQVQDEDGAWRRDLSLMTSSKIQTYNVRTAWGLALAGQLFDEPKWIKAASKNGDWALKQQRENGWFDHNGFTNEEMPLLHTIAYTLEGMLGMGLLLNKDEYVEAAQRGVQPLVNLYQKLGKLGGRYTPDWRACVSWRCLTGEAQIALILGRLARCCAKDASLAQVAKLILEGLSSVQGREVLYSETYGALAGSEPVWGGYCSFRYVNWAVKFYMDALLLALFDIDVNGSTPLARLSDQRLSARGNASAVENLVDREVRDDQ
jgi:hypothetical protein